MNDAVKNQAANVSRLVQAGEAIEEVTNRLEVMVRNVEHVLGVEALPSTESEDRTGVSNVNTLIYGVHEWVREINMLADRLNEAVEAIR